MLELKVLLLLLVANGAPILARRVFGSVASAAIDGGHCLADGQRLFGQTKTWRGVVAALLITPLCALLVSLPAVVGLLLAVAAMCGDLCSSFIKRRLGKASSNRMPAVDYVPESLLPALLGMALLHYSGWQALVIVIAFIVVELWLSPLLFSLGVRQHPH